MPSLNETLATDLKGFGPTPIRPALPPMETVAGRAGFKPNPSIRCPLPPFNVNIDTLRQFDGDNGQSPRRRVVPLPISVVSGGNSTVINKSTIITSGGGGSTSVTTALTAVAIVVDSGILAAGDLSAQTVVMSRSFQLISCSASGPCEIRIYGDAASQGADAGTVLDAPRPAELANDIITDVVFDTAPYVWTWQNRVGANNESPQNPVAYMTILNTSGAPADIQVVLVFLPLES